jgi:hypothetical protein
MKVIFLAMIVLFSSSCSSLPKNDFVGLGIVSFSDGYDLSRQKYRQWGYDGTGQGINFDWIPVSGIYSESVAKFSGLKLGDYIVKIDDKRVSIFCSYSFSKYRCYGPNLELPRIGVEGVYPKYSLNIPKTSMIITVFRSDPKSKKFIEAVVESNFVKLRGGKEISLQIKHSNDIKKFRSLMDEIRKK